jgi:hypothetical protein
MRQKAPNHLLEKLPPLREKVETIQFLKMSKKINKISVGKFL